MGFIVGQIVGLTGSYLHYTGNFLQNGKRRKFTTILRRIANCKLLSYEQEKYGEKTK